jgi:hypothetical protein
MTTYRELTREITGPTVADAVPTGAPLSVGASVPLDEIPDGLYRKDDGTTWIRDADGDAQVGGGGGFVPARNVGQASILASISGAPLSGGTHFLPFATVDGGDETMVTFGNYGGQPAVFPAVNGTYTWTFFITVGWSNFVQANPPQLTLIADADWFGVGGILDVPRPSDGAAVGGVAFMESVTWWADSGSPTQLNLKTNDAANAVTGVAVTLYVQRVA